jgi:hypothetical protein
VSSLISPSLCRVHYKAHSCHLRVMGLQDSWVIDWRCFFCRFANESSSMSKYVKIAALLPDKTVRDVALRCHWLSVRLCETIYQFNSSVLFTSFYGSHQALLSNKFPEKYFWAFQRVDVVRSSWLVDRFL